LASKWVKSSPFWLGPLVLTSLAYSDVAGQRAPVTPKFEKDVAPILKIRCSKCHGSASKMSGLDVSSVETLLKGGGQGASIIKGNAAKSLLYKRISEHTMPPASEKPLTDTEIRTIGEWLKTGAPSEKTSDVKKSKHWAFQPPVRPNTPKVKNAWWPHNPIDSFVLARLEARGIQPPKIADKRTLIRRVTLDLIGLPPTPDEVQRFLADQRPDAYERLVDDLLSRPQYGERWGRHWLDVVRYAESNGYERDGTKPSAWRYRDYVIDAFNKDKPYDRFITEQLAGDEVEGTNAETQIATTFLRLGTWDDEPADEKTDRYDQLDDILGTTSAVFLAQTLRCARCHDHKFEPFSQKDYYRTLAVFEPLKRPQDGRTDLDKLVGTPTELKVYAEKTKAADAEVAAVQKPLDELKQIVRERLFAAKKSALPAEAIAAFRAVPEKRTDQQKELVTNHTAALEKEIRAALTVAEKAQLEGLEKHIAAVNAARPKEPPHAYVLFEDSAKAAATCIRPRGDATKIGEEVQPGVPTILVTGQLEQPRPMERSTGRRLWLAQWLTRPDNPLTARVMVNRIWQHHFGEGIVPSENDFGTMGQQPKNQTLLDWLATEFVKNGWSIKRLQKLIVTSNTYKMTSAYDARTAKLDEEGKLFWRFPERRLEAEAVRDSILAVSGQLNLAGGGPSVYPTLPRAVLEGQSVPGQNWGKSDEKESSRRSIYIFVKRSLAVPELDVLDAPDTTSSCERRQVSTVAPQALTFLNGDFIRQQARYFAARLLKEVGADPSAQIQRAFELALCRPAKPEEVRDGLAFLVAQEKQIAADAEVVKKPAPDAKRRAMEAFCLVMLNTNEFVYLK
jgi:hypothetical protein